MNTHCLKVGYLDVILTKKNAGEQIVSRLLKDVLESQVVMCKPRYFDKDYLYRYKRRHAGIYPIDFYYDHAEYTDEVFRTGNLVFVDIDTTECADAVFRSSAGLKTLMPSLVSVWYSVSDKLHFAFLRHWEGSIEYGAYWKAVSTELVSCIGKMFGTDVAAVWFKNNDASLSAPTHAISAGYCRDFVWFDDADMFVCDEYVETEHKRRFLYRKIPFVSVEHYSLFTDAAVLNKWKKAPQIKTFVNWCKKNRDYRYRTQDRPYAWKVETVDGYDYNVWRNDGSVHLVDVPSSRGFILEDIRKRYMRAVAVLMSTFCDASFEETLYAVSRFYVENCKEYGAREDPSSLLLGIAEVAFANKERNRLKSEVTGWLCEKRQIVIDDHYAGTKYPTLKSEKQHVRCVVRKSDRIAVFKSVYEDTDTIEVLVMKMRAAGYPTIKEQTVRNICRECGVKPYKPKRIKEQKNKPKREKRSDDKGNYVYAFKRDGKKTRVKQNKVDGIIYFASKKAYNQWAANQ